MHSSDKKSFSLKYIHNDQCSRLQQRNQNEAQLLEDLRLFVKQKCVIEKAYGQSLMKLCQQFLTKIPQLIIAKSQKSSDSILLTDAWKNHLEKIEGVGRQRLQNSESQMAEVAEICKQLRSHRAQVARLVFDYLSDLQKECLQSSQDVQKSHKLYKEKFQKTREMQIRVKERIKSPSKVQNQLTQEMKACEARSDEARNIYLLDLATSNSQLKEFRTSHLPELVRLIDEEIHEDWKKLLGLFSESERRNCNAGLKYCDDINVSCAKISKEYDVGCFIRDNPCFTEVLENSFVPHSGDGASSITISPSTEPELVREARRSSILAVREAKAVEKCQAELSKIPLDGLPVEERAKIYEVHFNLKRVILDSKSRREKCLARLKSMEEGGLDISIHMNEAMSKTQAVVTGGQDEDVDSFDSKFDSTKDEMANIRETSSIVDDWSTNLYPYWCSALYDYEAVNQDELSFKANDRLKMIADGSGDGWFWAENTSGNQGLVPQNYISLFSDGGIVEESNVWPSPGGEHGDTPRESERVLRAAPPPPLEKSKETKGASKSYFANIAVEQPVIMNQGEPTSNKSDKLSDSTTDVFWVRALYDYEATCDEEISFSEGQLIKVTLTSRDVDDGWWEGEIKGRRGIFPSMIVEEVFVLIPNEANPKSSVWRSTFNLSSGKQQNNKEHSAEDDNNNNNNNNKSHGELCTNPTQRSESEDGEKIPLEDHTQLRDRSNNWKSEQNKVFTSGSADLEPRSFDSENNKEISQWLRKQADPFFVGSTTLGRRQVNHHLEDFQSRPKFDWDVNPSFQGSGSSSTPKANVQFTSRKLFSDDDQHVQNTDNCSGRPMKRSSVGNGAAISQQRIPSYHQLMKDRQNFSTLPRLYPSHQVTARGGLHQMNLPDACVNNSNPSGMFHFNDCNRQLSKDNHCWTSGNYYSTPPNRLVTSHVTSPHPVSYSGYSSRVTGNPDLKTFRKNSESRESFI